MMLGHANLFITWYKACRADAERATAAAAGTSSIRQNKSGQARLTLSQRSHYGRRSPTPCGGGQRMQDSPGWGDLNDGPPPPIGLEAAES